MPKYPTSTSLFVLLFIWSSVHAILKPIASSNSHHQSLSSASTNTIVELNPVCDAHTINATLRLAGAFKGVIFAKDFSQECRILGTSSNSSSISLPTRGCGVRLISQDVRNGSSSMVLNVVLVMQQDRHLRQIADQERLVECSLPPEAFRIRSSAMGDYLQKTGTPTTSRASTGSTNRTSRSRRTDSTDLSQRMMHNSRAWMEIESDLQMPSNTASDKVQVGDQIRLTIKTTLPVGIGWKAVDCIAHDGLGDSSQRLLGTDGCPVDAVLVPAPSAGLPKLMANRLMQHQVAVSRFAAFKFPDRERLHLVCGLQICKGLCPQVNCSRSSITVTEQSKPGESDRILDRIDVFNSIEVHAPGIDEFTKNSIVKIEEDTTAEYLRNIPLLDRTFCISPDTLAFTFCGMGLVFLAALFVSVWALVRARRNKGATSSTRGSGIFYTRSAFSSTTSGSGYDSKLLSDSPCMGQSSARTPPGPNMSYGRIL